MDIILIPGFWLDGSSWDKVAPAIERAGHRAGHWPQFTRPGELGRLIATSAAA